MTTLKQAELADIFDAMADYVDHTAGALLREKQAAQQTRVAAFAEHYTEMTGEEVPSDLRAKLASLDEDVFEHVLKTLKTAGGSPDSLGGPAETDNTKIADEADADARMLHWLTT